MRRAAPRAARAPSMPVLVLMPMPVPAVTVSPLDPNPLMVSCEPLMLEVAPAPKMISSTVMLSGMFRLPTVCRNSPCNDFELENFELFCSAIFVFYSSQTNQ